MSFPIASDHTSHTAHKSGNSRKIKAYIYRPISEDFVTKIFRTSDLQNTTDFWK